MGRQPTREPATWSTPRDALTIVCTRPHLTRSVTTTHIVGTVLFAINQLDVVLSRHATSVTWLKVAVTYSVPFCVTNIGILIGTRAQPTDDENRGASR